MKPSAEVAGHLILVRHGQTNHNVARRFQGQANTGLNTIGLEQAQGLGQHLANMGFHQPMIHSSDLARAAQTAEQLQQALGGQLYLTKQLREIHIGDWEDQDYADIEEADPKSTERFWGGDFKFQIPGGESPEQVAQRAAAYVHQHWPKAGKCTIVVSHGVALSGLLCHLLQLEYQPTWQSRQLFHGNCDFSVLTTGPQPEQIIHSEVAMAVPDVEWKRG